MDHLIKLSVGCFLSLFLFLSCSDDDSDNLFDQPYMSAVIDGVNYHMTEKDSDLYAEKFIGPSGILKLKVYALSHQGKHIKILVPDYMGPGTYLAGENPMLPTFLEFEEAQPYGLWSCNNPGPNDVEKNFIEISLDNGYIIEGSFDFSAQNFEDNSLRKISEGKFRVKAE